MVHRIIHKTANAIGSDKWLFRKLKHNEINNNQESIVVKITAPKAKAEATAGNEFVRAPFPGPSEGEIVPVLSSIQNTEVHWFLVNILTNYNIRWLS